MGDAPVDGPGTAPRRSRGGLLPGILQYTGRVLLAWQKKGGKVRLPRGLVRQASRRHPRLRRRLLAQVNFLAHKVVCWWNQLTFLRDSVLVPDLAGIPLPEDPTLFLASLLAALYLERHEGKRVRPRDILGKGASPGGRGVNASLRGIISGALRRAAGADLGELVRKMDQVEQDAILWAHPTFYIEKVRGALGAAGNLEALFQKNNTRDTFFVRVNTLRSTPVEFVEWCGRVGVEVERVDEFDFLFGVSLQGRRTLLSQPEFRDGNYYFQDFASVLACSVVHPRPGETVIEVGAAPFIKTTLLLTMQGSPTHPRFVTVDYSWRRIRRNVGTFEKWGGSKPEVVCADGTKLPFRRVTAKVFIDAPCTGSGALASMPEMKWKQSGDYLQEHAHLQGKLVGEAISVLEGGSSLVYCVCSVYREEGEGVLEKFAGSLSVVESKRTWPHLDDSQGFFMASCEVVRGARGHLTPSS
ncbi:MAG: hypothetical protein ACTSU5_20450 [Promethearchaeota archaeon]